MLKLKTATPSLAALEQSVADAKAKLDQSLAAHRAARIDLEIAKSDVAEAETPENMLAFTTTRTASQATSQDVANSKTALAESEKALALAQTMPQRQASAKRIDEAVAVLKKAHPAVRLALASMCEALGVASFPEAAGSQAGGLFSHWMHSANAAAVGGDLEKFIGELEAYRNGILDGTKPASLGATLQQQRAA